LFLTSSALMWLFLLKAHEGSHPATTIMAARVEENYDFADEGVEMAITHASVSIADEAILPWRALVDSP
jgi:hypothetical protein